MKQGGDPSSAVLVCVLSAIAIGLISEALAVIIPSRQAAKLQVVEALRYE